MDPTLREWCYAREVLRRLGFEPGEIYFVVAPSGIVKDNNTGIVTEVDRPLIGLEIHRGGKTFTWTIGGTNLPLDQIQPAYEKAVEDWNADDQTMFPHEEFLKSNAVRDSVRLMLALKTKGFELR